VEELCKDCVVIVFQYACDQQLQPIAGATNTTPNNSMLMHKASSNDALSSLAVATRSNNLMRNRSLMLNSTSGSVFKSKLK
jgi:hypothetical protein